MNKITVNAFWDDDARVWVATSEQVPGLVAEAGSRQELQEILSTMVPELLKLNGLIEESKAHKGFDFTLRQESIINVVAC